MFNPHAKVPSVRNKTIYKMAQDQGDIVACSTSKQKMRALKKKKHNKMAPSLVPSVVAQEKEMSMSKVPDMSKVA